MFYLGMFHTNWMKLLYSRYDLIVPKRHSCLTLPLLLVDLYPNLRISNRKNKNKK